ncbi:MAG: RHS repeat-associated core domain-containing protein, partial [Bacteroidota bacterium]
AGFSAKHDFLAKINPNAAKVRHYCNGIEYFEGEMEAIYHEVGRVFFENNLPVYEWTLSDHLGNTRVVFRDDGTGTAQEVQQNDYYAFGLAFEIQQNTHAYTYNGKEEQIELNINWLDYGFRYFDPAIARWNVVDNLAEKFVSFSTYHYAGNNPVRNIDVDGNEFTKDAWEWVNKVVDEINSRQKTNNEKIAKINTTLKAGDLKGGKKKRLEKRANKLEKDNQELETVKSEIATLEASSQKYDVRETNELYEAGAVHGTGTDVAATYYNFENNALEIAVSSGASVELFAHELKHAYQFEIGEASYGGLMEVAPIFLLDKQDELAGYQRQGLFGSNEGVTNIRTLPERYSQLPTGPISIHNVDQATQDAIRLNNTIGLQAIANRTRQAFRVNGKTYIPTLK